MINYKNILKIDTRRDIYQFIFNNPGTHQREISKKIKIARSTLLYHLRVLEKQDLINSYHFKGYKRYYIYNKYCQKDKQLLKLLREKTIRHILINIIFERACSQIELAENLQKTPTTIMFHLKKLIDANIIELSPIKEGKLLRIKPGTVILRKPVRNEKIYRITKEYLRPICVLLTVYEKSFSKDDIIGDVLRTLKNDMKNRANIQKLLSPKNQIEAILNAGFDIFPHPYYA